MAVIFKVSDQVQIKATNEAALPTADATQVGRLIRVPGGAGVDDALYLCRKKADGSYAWESFSNINAASLGAVKTSGDVMTGVLAFNGRFTIQYNASTDSLDINVL